MNRSEIQKRQEFDKSQQDSFYTLTCDRQSLRVAKRVITLDVCNEITVKLKNHLGKDIEKFSIDMAEYDLDMSIGDYEMVIYGDISPRKIIDKKLYYNAVKNKMVIWENGYPIYENNNGKICKDKISLADHCC